MTTIDDVATYVTEKFATDIAPTELPAELDLTATGILTSISTVQLLGWCGRTYRIPINSLSIDPRELRTTAGIATFIDTHRTDLTA